MATVVGILDRDRWSEDTDNIVIADPADKTLTWIPRDLWCPSLGDRINTAFHVGGIARLVSALRELGFACDHGLVLRRSATERAAMSISVEVPVSEPVEFWYPLHPTQLLEDGQKVVSFRPPSERLESERIHQWVGARTGIAREGIRLQDTDWHRMRRQQIFLRALLEQHFDFSTLVADKDLVRISGEDALRELASIDASWRMQSFEDTRDETIDGKVVLVKRSKQAALNNSSTPQLAVVTVEPANASHTVLTKHLFGSRWSPRRLLRRPPRVIAIFSFRYDAHLVPNLIENLRPIVDGYIAYDDRGASEPYTDERARKAVLRREAREMGAQWLLCIDPDERLEMAAASRMRTMTSVIEPVAWQFRLRELYMPTAYRVDGSWKKKTLTCLFPLLDGQIFSDAPLHGRRSPLNPEYEKRDSGLNLYHLKMIGPERREARRDFYRALDPTNAYQTIGYDYLGDETGLVLKEVPPSRQYRPLHRETGANWQPDLKAIQPLAEIAVPESRSATPGPDKDGGDKRPVSAPPRQGRRLTAPFKRLARAALGAAVGVFPDASDRAALFALSQLAGRKLTDRARLAKLRDIVAKRTPPEAAPKRGKERRAKEQDRIPNSLVIRIQALFSDPPPDWSAEDRILVMCALRRLGLLTEWDFHVLLTRLFAERRLEHVGAVVDDDSLGFELVRDFHRLRLRSFLGDKSVTLADLAELRARAKGSFLYSTSYNDFLTHGIATGAVDEIERDLIDVDQSQPIRVSDDVIMGGCRLLRAHGRHRSAAQALERHVERMDEEETLRFIEPLLRLDEEGALSPPLSAFCRQFRPEIGRAVTKRLKEVYVAVDDIDRAQFNRFIIEPLLALEAVKPNFMDVRFSPEQRRSLRDTIIERLESKEPLSLIRLGDGEAYAFPIPEVEGIDLNPFEDDDALRERLWWGSTPPAHIANDIKNAVRRSVASCDIIGLPSISRVLRGLFRPRRRYGESHEQRGIMTVLAACGGAIPMTGKMVTEERCHQSALSKTAIDEIAPAADMVVVVSCWGEHELRFPASRTRYIVVPPEHKVRGLAASRDGRPIFEIYREIAAKVCEELGPGKLVLVGAGIVGKIFIEEAKCAGAVALDVGSLLDYMAGHYTRPLADAPDLMS